MTTEADMYYWWFGESHIDYAHSETFRKPATLIEILRVEPDTKEYCATCSAPRNPNCVGCKHDF